MEHSTSFFCGRPERLVPLVQVGYEVYHGAIFEVSGDQVRGLLNNADHVFVDLLKDRATPKDLVARIQKAAQAR